ncbi:NTP transferase domain-containing protein [bacterium]|nr:NTP transferase domain-containing protein [bacterium]
MTVKKALIIAAGCGSRLNGGKSKPKPLYRVAGLPLIKRIILTAKKAGLSEFVIVVGYEKEKLIKAILKEDLGVKIDFVENPDWTKPNGLSVLAAKPHLNENFVILMSDHIFEAQTLESFKKEPMGDNQVLLAVDYKIKSIVDLDDATKVEVENNKIKNIGKEIAHYNAIDTGMFLATPELFNALEEVKQKGEIVSLSAGIKLLANKNQMGTYDIKNGYWQDVDTKPTLKAAEKHLMNSCRKETDGFISRNFNRHISLWVSGWLSKTNLSANHITGLTFFVGVFSGVFAARGDYWSVLFGAFLFQLSSILDGCDGEISKLKMTASVFGQWFDTICDNLTYVIFIIGIIMGLHKVGDPHITLKASLTVFGLFMILTMMFTYLLRNTNSGSLLAIQSDFQKEAKKGGIKAFFGKIQFMLKRDFFAVIFFVVALIGGPSPILWMCLVGANAAWMVLLFSKLTANRNQHALVADREI